MNVEEYLKKFQFTCLSSEEKERIWQRIEKEIEKAEVEKVTLIDSLWNWKWAVSAVSMILLLLIFNLHIVNMERYPEQIMPVVSYREQILDPDTQKLLTFLDKNPEPSLRDYLKYRMEVKQRKGFNDYILRIQELTG